MSEAHDEQWCDRQLVHAERMLQYLRLRDRVVIERVEAVQELALQQSCKTRLVLEAFHKLLCGTATYHAPVVEATTPLPQSQHALKSLNFLSQSEPRESQKSHNVGSCALRNTTNSDYELQRRPKSGVAEPQRRPASQRPSSLHSESPVRTNKKSEPALERLSNLRQLARPSLQDSRPKSSARSKFSNAHRKQSSIAARELSEARLKVLNRQRIVAERKKNMVRSLPMNAATRPTGPVHRAAVEPGSDVAETPHNTGALTSNEARAPAIRLPAIPLRSRIAMPQHLPFSRYPASHELQHHGTVLPRNWRDQAPGHMDGQSLRAASELSAAGPQRELRHNNALREGQEGDSNRQRHERPLSASFASRNTWGARYQIQAPSNGRATSRYAQTRREPQHVSVHIGPRRLVPSGPCVKSRAQPYSRDHVSLRRILNRKPTSSLGN